MIEIPLIVWPINVIIAVYKLFVHYEHIESQLKGKLAVSESNWELCNILPLK